MPPRGDARANRPMAPADGDNGCPSGALEAGGASSAGTELGKTVRLDTASRPPPCFASPKVWNCEGFRMLAVAQVGTGRGAGVRKPPGKEPAGRSSVAGRSMGILASRAGGARGGGGGGRKERQGRGGEGGGWGGDQPPWGGGGRGPAQRAPA